ncbi:MAG TPA: MgtC/SapB family protein [Candidatus Fimadaptatus faecigallinarum]|uniref:MgtC/SapB family protein n=1 Tax=Candidatus Fimadaptatus faecigallinarum TaxID=2840814 RepID=A0A9D1LSI9_9FIRM|nr:MgtC/SapB family protein [Candidatus Fimadaptatus faecigallinarum]
MAQDYIVSILGAWAGELNTGSILLRIVLSLILSSIVGCERSSKRHSAGLRTFMIVSLASTTAAIIEIYMLGSGQSVMWITAAVIVGSASISGYSILFSSKGQIKGLTTSAGLWACGIIGIAIGIGLYTAALIAYAALLCSLSFFPAFEKYLKDKSNHFEVHLELKNKTDLGYFTTTIRRLGMRIDDIELNPAYLNSGLSVYTVSFTISSQELKKYKKHSEIIEALRSLDYISYIEEIG